MKKIKLTNEEIENLRGALNYYVYEASHGRLTEEGEPLTGLPEGKEEKVLKSILNKINQDAKGRKRE